MQSIAEVPPHIVDKSVVWVKVINPEDKSKRAYRWLAGTIKQVFGLKRMC
jgi:hypothetical protein